MENKEAEALECMADGDKCVNSSKGIKIIVKKHYSMSILYQHSC